jgi:hypothetical protein
VPRRKDFPLGLIQMCAIRHADQVKGEELPGWLEWLPTTATSPGKTQDVSLNNPAAF